MFRDRQLLTWLCCGSHFIHEIITRSVKRYIGQDRPKDGPPSVGLFDGPYGMPSQHVACSTYLTIMVTLLLFYHYRHYGDTKSKLFSVIILFIGLAIQCHARLYLRYHDLMQVLAGLVYGCLSCLTFFILIESCMPLAPRICKWPIFKQLNFTPDFIVPTIKRQLELGFKKNQNSFKRLKRQ